VGSLEPFADQVWLARGPLRLFGVPMGRVMTVVRLGDGGLWVHSPAPLDDALRRELKELGEVRWVVAPNKLHGHLSMGEYRRAFPESRLLAAPGLPERRKDLVFDDVLGDEPDPAWGGAFDQLLLRHAWLPEVVFHHRPSRTLVTGDVCWNVGGMPVRAQLWAGRRGGVGPTFLHRRGFRKQPVRREVDRVVAWEPERLVCGHGDPLPSGARDAFARAYEFA
jgi:Domain of unknown function (DUF4336)